MTRFHRLRFFLNNIIEHAQLIRPEYPFWISGKMALHSRSKIIDVTSDVLRKPEEDFGIHNAHRNSFCYLAQQHCSAIQQRTVISGITLRREKLCASTEFRINRIASHERSSLVNVITVRSNTGKRTPRSSRSFSVHVQLLSRKTQFFLYRIWNHLSRNSIKMYLTNWFFFYGNDEDRIGCRESRHLCLVSRRLFTHYLRLSIS